MPDRHILSGIAGVVVIAAYFPYIRAILAKQAIPAKASWLIWATIDSLLLYGMFVRHVVNGQILGTVVMIWIVVVLAFFYGEAGWSRLDKLCLTGAVTGLILVLINPTWSIVLLAIISFIGAVPTFHSAWRDPAREDRVTWAMYWISCVFTVIAIPVWSLSAGAQPVSFLIVQTTMVYLLFVRPHWNLRPQHDRA
jgi:hypothetical protein